MNSSGDGSDPSAEFVAKVRNSGADKGIVTTRGGATLYDLVRALRSIGARPKDLIEVLQAIKAAGALTAEIEII